MPHAILIADSLNRRVLSQNGKLQAADTGGSHENNFTGKRFV